MKECAFVLLVKLDSIVRIENVLMVVDYLLKFKDIEICLCEVGTYQNDILPKLIPREANYTFIQDDDPILHRTKYLNQIIKDIDKKYIAVWDVDVVAPANQLFSAIKLLENGADFVYPYCSYFYDISEELRKIYMETRNIGLLIKYSPFMKEMYAPNPVGGAFFVNKNSYIKCGMENELFYGWGVEDGERFCRWKSLGMQVKRVKGPLFHLSHPRGLNSLMQTNDQSIIKHRIRLASTRGKEWKLI